MATIWEDTKKNTAQMKGRPPKEIIDYIWEYYKIHIIIGISVIAFIVAIIHAVVTSRDYGLGIVLINAVSPEYSTDYSDWQTDLNEILELDTSKYEVFVDDTITLGLSTNTGNAEYSSQQKLAALMSSECIDVLISNTPSFEHYAQLDYMYNLREFLSEEDFKQYEDAGLIYYTDASTYSDYDSETITDPDSLQAGYVIDHHDPDSMKDPIPVGIVLDEASKVIAKNIYAYLYGQDDFQGNAQEVILGVPVNCIRLEQAKKAIHYLTNK